MIEPNTTNKAEILQAIELSLKQKEEENFFSQGIVSFIHLSYSYIGLMNNKYKDFEGTFYHVVALTMYPQKELLYLIFNQYEALKTKAFSVDTLPYSEPLINTIFTEVVNLKKYKLAFAVTEIHRLLIDELQTLFVKNKNVKYQERVIYLINKITRSRKIQKGTREEYKKIKEKIKLNSKLG